MSKHNKYMLVYWYWDGSSDHPASFDTAFEYVTDKQLDDITQLMKDYGIKQWVKDPETINSSTYTDGDGSLVEFRNLIVKPMKIVESWSYTSEVGK